MNASPTADLPQDRPLVVVTVGSDHHRFDRLIQWVDSWIASRTDNGVDCVIQHGTATKPTHGRSVDYLDHGELQRLFANATAVVAQGGPLSVIESLRAGRRPIVVPRLAQLDEVVDDHQRSFCAFLAARGQVIVADDASTLAAELDAAIADPGYVRFTPEDDGGARDAAIEQIARTAESLATQRRGRGPTVLMLGGFGRSGSTLLERCLGEAPDVAAVGEVLHLWERGLLHDERCGCGLRFSECPFWRSIGKRAFGDWSRVIPAAAAHDRSAVVRTRRLGGLLIGAIRPRRRLEQSRLTRRLGNLYAAIQEESGASVLVDSSKHPAYAFLLRRAPVRLRCVLVVRDPRGVAFSWQKSVVRPEVPDDVAHMPQYSVLYTAMRWLGYNVLFHFLSLLRVPVITVRYEDFMAAPKRTVSEILRFAGLEPSERETAHIRHNSVTLGVHHTVAGNPMRFEVGEIKFRPDDEWQSGLRAPSRAIVSLLTAPLRVVYGYMRWSKSKIDSDSAAAPVNPLDAPPSLVESRDDSPRGKHARTYQ
jgi:UDP-N-acetylglucosamine transferase subunit ALG13